MSAGGWVVYFGGGYPLPLSFAQIILSFVRKQGSRSVALQQPDRQDFPLAVLLSSGSRTVTESYRAAPFQGWSVTLTPDAVGGEI
jgi:hypothetical protein